MSVATEITRLQTAKSNLKTAIEAKGVTVPSNALISDYSTYVSQISGGGGVDPTLFQFSDRTISYLSGTGAWGALMKAYVSYLTFTNIGDNVSYAFSGLSYDTIGTVDFSSVTVNFKDVNASVNFSNAFQDSTAITKLPKFVGASNAVTKITTSQRIFDGCQRLKEIKSEFMTNIAEASNNQSNSGYIFYNCRRLRTLDGDVDKKLFNRKSNATSTTGANLGYSHRYMNCASLDEIVSCPVNNTTESPNSNIKSNMFGSTSSDQILSGCYHLRKFLFETNSGTPYTSKWSNQTLYFKIYSSGVPTGSCVGIDYSSSDILVNSYGFSGAKEITDDASYASLKNDPDSWTKDRRYAQLYCHDNLIAFFNSLPNVTSGTNNIISYVAGSGSKCDGGGIDELTTAEINIAQNKGWTIAIVM